MGLTFLLFMATVFLFWTTDYCYNVLHAKHDEVLYVFIVVCATAPTLGYLIGGSMIDIAVVGHMPKHSIALSFLFSMLSLLSTFSVRLLPGIYSFGIALWVILFSSSSVFSTLHTAMLGSLCHELKAAGNSVSVIIFNSFGYLPAPFLYGFIYEKSQNSDPKLAMSLMLWIPSVISVFFISLAMLLRFRSWKEVESEESKIM